MQNANLSHRVHYLGVQRNDALTAALERGVALLAPYQHRVAHCDVHVGRWVQHHGQATSYRVALELEPEAGALPVCIECESALNPQDPALLALVQEAFTRAARRLAAREQQAADQPPSRLSADARRLHPLHGLAPEERQFGADEE